ncbi:MAG: nucleotidyltransferase family protein [Ruminococcus sp.]|uniref:nucleotidyltransferase domain-containing protein n=1 Tax=Ruminococcus sp. TaxID=41978 RepID=UPI0025D2DA76|nr:nucleotidyltransferase family protein [Ruminococcus sp.]MCR5540829.1 nucleotidyltransferase family protein [Ruminococcus sp.]
MKLTTTQVALLEAIKASLFDIEPNFPADTDWDEVVKEAKAQTVLGIISTVIPVKDVSVEMGKATYMRLLFEQDKLIKLLDANDIPCVILKGSAAAQYYPKPHLRAMGDVDFLVPHDKYETAVKLLESNGYEYHHGKTQDGKIPEEVRHIGYMKNGIEYEIHHHFSSKGFDIDNYLDLAFDKIEYRELDGYRIPMLPDIENGFVLLGHLNQHLVAENLGLRQVIDWLMYVNKVMNEEIWNNQFAPIAEKVGMKKLADNITMMCVKYLESPKCYLIDNKSDEDTSDLLLNMILESGNFGSKIASDQKKTDSVISFGIYNIKKNGFFPYFQDMGLRKWKLCQKYSVFQPFAWIYGILRSLIRGLISLIKYGGLKKQIEVGDDRYILFEKLGIEASSKIKCPLDDK